MMKNWQNKQPLVQALTTMVLAFWLPLSAAARPSPSESNPPATEVKTLSVADLEKGVWLAEDADYVELERQIIRHLQQTPYSSFGHYLLSLLMMRDFARAPQHIDTLRRASEIAQQSIELAPFSDYGYIALAEVLDLMGQAPKAAELVTKAIMHGMEPSWRTYFILARLNAEVGSTERVFAYLEQSMAYQNSLHDVIVPYIIAMIEASQPKGQQRQKLLASWQARFPHKLFHHSLAIAMAENGEYQAAVTLYEQIINEHEGFDEAKLNKAIIMYRHLKQEKKALELMSALYEKQAGFDTHLKFLLHSHMGSAYLALKQSQKAEYFLLQAATVSDERSQYLQFVQRQYVHYGQESALSSLYQNLIATLPGQADIHALHAEALSVHNQRHDDAIQSYLNAILLDPDSSGYRNGLGLTLYRLKRFDDALETFLSAVRVNPSDAVAHYNYACILALKGEREKALAALQEAVSLDPSLIAIAKEDQDFASLRSSQTFANLISGRFDLEQTSDYDEMLDDFAH